MEKVSVGKGTYGPLRIFSWGAENEGLKIGNFVSIGHDTTFVLGGNHYSDHFSTYPFRVKMLGHKEEAVSKGKIVIEDDAWIGMDCMILSGVTIGKGAIVAARSVVTRSVPPYSVVAGNPARVIKYRFNDSIIEQISQFDYSLINKEFVERNEKNIYRKLDDKILSDLIKDIRNQ
jgi:acetyltransferase-like isoleucine patch superfamily enzyme